MEEAKKSPVHWKDYWWVALLGVAFFCFFHIVEFLDGDGHNVHYVRRPFQREPDFGVTSVNYDFAELIVRAAKPS